MQVQEPLVQRARNTGGLPSRVMALVAVVALVMGVFAPAAAAEDPPTDVDVPPWITITGQSGKWTTFEGPLGRIYGNITQVDGYAAITGGDLEDVCDGVPPEAGAGRFRQKKDGTYVVRTLPGGQSTSVAIYKTDTEVLTFIQEQCPLYAAGGELPQPIARGVVVLRDKAWDQPEPFPMVGEGRYKNSIRGWAWDDDGNAYRVRATVDYEVDPATGPTFVSTTLRVKKISD